MTPRYQPKPHLEVLSALKTTATTGSATLSAKFDTLRRKINTNWEVLS
jgi:hypothetical protein